MAKKSKKAKGTATLEVAEGLMNSRRLLMERVALAKAVSRKRAATVVASADVWDDERRPATSLVESDEELTAAVGWLMQSLIDYGTAVKLAHEHGADLDSIASAAAFGEDVSIDEIRCVMCFSESNS